MKIFNAAVILIIALTNSVSTEAWIDIFSDAVRDVKDVLVDAEIVAVGDVGEAVGETQNVAQNVGSPANDPPPHD